MTKYKPIHEHQDGRGTSVRYANQTIKRRKARRIACLLYTSPSPRDAHESRMPSSA